MAEDPQDRDDRTVRRVLPAVAARQLGRQLASVPTAGDLARAAADGRLTRGDVAELGRVLTGEHEGRRGEEDITVFDSTGLAVQDLAVALAVYERYRSNPGAKEFVEITAIDVE